MNILTIHNQDIALQVREAGPADGELIILLHGFPECWNTWRHQIEPLAAAGFRVCVPDMRGYGESSKPDDYRRYHLNELITDIEALRQHYGRERFHLAGHDWGAAVAWWYALHHEEKLASLSILNVPHPFTFLSKLKSSPLQMLKSWYIFYFQLPWLPEWSMRRFNYEFLRLILKRSATPGAYNAEDFRNLQHSWQQPGCLTAMVNYYRALLRHIQLPAQDGRLQVPTQILWGERDLALSLQSAHDSAAFLTQGELITYPDATHWLAHDKPAEISQRLISHCRANPVTALSEPATKSF